MYSLLILLRTSSNNIRKLKVVFASKIAICDIHGALFKINTRPNSLVAGGKPHVVSKWYSRLDHHLMGRWPTQSITYSIPSNHLYHALIGKSLNVWNACELGRHSRKSTFTLEYIYICTYDIQCRPLINHSVCDVALYQLPPL